MKRNILRLSLIASLLLHASGTLMVWLEPFEQPKAKAPAQVELLSPEDLQKLMHPREDKSKGQIVEQDKQFNDETPKDSKYLSKFNQRVEKETRAARNGKFSNSAKVGALVPPKPEAQAIADAKKTKHKSEPKKNYVTSPQGIAALPSWRDLKPEFKMGPIADTSTTQNGEEPSATDDHLKDVDTGSQTLLNTREFIYYSYYNRIKDKLRQYWEPKIKEKMEHMLRSGRQLASTSERVTRTVLILDAKGVLVRVQILSPSGVTDLDDAAVEAFRAAAPFPNPPHGIVEDDGTIKIRWDFILEA